MVITLNTNPEQELALRQTWGEDLARITFEALVIEGYRSGRFGTATVRTLLGHSTRQDTEHWLASRGVPVNYSLADLNADRENLDKLFDKSA